MGVQANAAVPLPPLGTRGLPREHQFGRMTLDYGLAHERAMLRWCDEMLSHLSAKKRRAPSRTPKG